MAGNVDHLEHGCRRAGDVLFLSGGTVWAFPGVACDWLTSMESAPVQSLNLYSARLVRSKDAGANAVRLQLGRVRPFETYMREQHVWMDGDGMEHLGEECETSIACGLRTANANRRCRCRVPHPFRPRETNTHHYTVRF